MDSYYLGNTVTIETNLSSTGIIFIVFYLTVFLFNFQKLNSSAFSVTSESFVPMLARLDECISFLSSNVSLAWMN